MTCIIKRAATYSTFTEPGLAKMPQRNDDPVDEYTQESNSTGTNASSCTVAVSSAATWDHQQTTTMEVPAGGEGRRRGLRVASSSASSHHQVLPKPWWESQLAEEIHSTLQERERMLAAIKFESPQLNIR